MLLTVKKIFSVFVSTALNRVLSLALTIISQNSLNSYEFSVFMFIRSIGAFVESIFTNTVGHKLQTDSVKLNFNLHVFVTLTTSSILFAVVGFIISISSIENIAFHEAFLFIVIFFSMCLNVGLTRIFYGLELYKRIAVYSLYSGIMSSLFVSILLLFSKQLYVFYISICIILAIDIFLKCKAIIDSGFFCNFKFSFDSVLCKINFCLSPSKFYALGSAILGPSFVMYIKYDMVDSNRLYEIYANFEYSFIIPTAVLFIVGAVVNYFHTELSKIDLTHSASLLVKSMIINVVIIIVFYLFLSCAFLLLDGSNKLILIYNINSSSIMFFSFCFLFHGSVSRLYVISGLYWQMLISSIISLFIAVFFYKFYDVSVSSVYVTLSLYFGFSALLMCFNLTRKWTAREVR